MIFTNRTITVRKGESRIDEPIVVYRGDYELEVRFTILNSKFKFKSGTNMIETEKASYGQLAILTPYGGNIFSDIVRCDDGSVTFVLTAEMLNQIEEVGLYSFQIRLMDYNKESRVSIPPIEFGIEVREPIASEDHDNSVNNAIVGYSIAKVVDPKEENVGDTFDANGQYNKTDWETGDRITEGKLNKIEDALDKINQNEKNDVTALDKRVTNNFITLNTTKAEANDLLVERKRIDAISTLNQGSTTGDAELIDGRIGADGTTHTNIGTAIRDQINVLTQMINPTTEDIYRNGTEYVKFVKGFSSSVNSTTVENTGEFYRITHVPSGTASSQSCIVTDSKVNLTDVNYVYFDVTQLCNHAGVRTSLTIGSTKDARRESGTWIKQHHIHHAVDRRIYKFDVRDISGSYYIAVHTAQTGTSTAANTIPEVNLYGVWLVYDKQKELEGKFKSIDDEFVRVDESITSVESHVNKIDSEYLNSVRYSLYDNGVEDLTFGNGFESGYLEANSSGTVTKLETHIEIAFDGLNAATPDKAIVTNQQIDVTDVEYISVEWEMVGISSYESMRANIGLDSSNNASRLTDSIFQLNGVFDRRTSSIDVKNKTGKMYLSVHGGGNGLKAAGILKIYKISLSLKNNQIVNTTLKDIPAIYKELSDRSPLAMRCMIYQEGVEDTTIGGGLIDGYVQANSTGSVIRNEDHIVLNYNGNKSYTSDTAITTSKKVNLEHVDYIIVDWAHAIYSLSTRSHVCVSNSQITHRLDGTVIQVDGGFSRRVDVVDVRHVVNERYISVHAGNNSIKGNGHMEVYGIYLAYNNTAIVSGSVSSEKPKDFIPEYWKNELNDSINKITALQRAGGNQCTSVGFITDIHLNSRTMYSPILMKTILNECNIPYYFDGGDVVRGSGLEKKDKLISLIIEERKAFEDIQDRCLRVIGNHDPAYSELGGENYYAQNLTHEETYDIFFRPSTFGNNLVWGDEGKYFYVDDNMHKIRYIGLDSTDTPYDVNKMRLFCFRQTQINWLANVALDVPDNTWSVVVCSHYAPTTYNTSHSIVNSHIILDILKAFKNNTSYSASGGNASYPVSVNVDYTNKGGDVVCWMYGHVHADNINVANEITVVSTEADTVDADDNVTTGTIQEHAFDIFTINKATRTVNITRTGLGEDRSFTY